MADLLNFEKIKKNLSEYIEVRLELLKLDITEHVADMLAQVIAYLIIILLAAFVLSLVSIGISFYLNDLLNTKYWGFFITAGIYSIGLIAVLLTLKSGKLKSFFETIIVNQSEDKRGDDEEE